MRIVGCEGNDGPGVETIDVWFSQRRQAWIIERIDAEGNQIGAAHLCEEADVAACVADWLRAHESVQLVTPYGSLRRQAAARSRPPRRRAA